MDSEKKDDKKLSLGGKFCLGVIVITIALVGIGMLMNALGYEETKTLNGVDFSLPTTMNDVTLSMEQNDTTITVKGQKYDGSDLIFSEWIFIHSANSYEEVFNKARERPGFNEPFENRSNTVSDIKIGNVDVKKINLNYGDTDFYYYFEKEGKHFYISGNVERWDESIIEKLIS